MRWLLVQAAISTLRLRKLETAALRARAERIVVRRGKKIAVVALAGRLAGILYAMMRDGTVYRPAPMRPVATTSNPVAVAS